MSRERLEITSVGGERCPARLGGCHHDGVHRRASSGLSPQEGGTPRESFRNLLHEVAGVEKAVRQGVATGMPLQALYENHCRDEGRPQVELSEGEDERRSLPRALGQSADSSRVQHEHDSARLPLASSDEPFSDEPRTSPLPCGGFPDLCHQVAQIAISLCQKVQPAHFCPHRPLQQLRCGQMTRFHQVVQVVRKVDLNPWHAPTYTYRCSLCARPTSSA